MNLSWTVIRIALALAVIFTLGVVVGRLTSPDPTPPVAEVEAERLDLTETGRKVMQRYQEQLDLTGEQVAALEEKFALVSRRMEILPRRSRARLAVLEDFHEEMAPHLTEAQRMMADQILESARSMERPR